MSSKRHNPRGLFATIGARLTLWWTAITLGTCAAVCIGLYFGLAYSLSREVDGFLEGEVQEFMTILNEESKQTFAEIERDIRRELGSRLRGDLTFRLLDRQGKIVLSSVPNDSWRRLQNPPPEKLALDRPVFSTIHVPTERWSYRICSQWVSLSNRGFFEAQATYRLDRYALSLAGFRRLCVVAMAVATALSVVCGLVLARKTLRPVRLMTESAMRIGAQNLSDRVARTGNGDELDNMAAVLNDMLQRLERQFEDIQRFTADAAHELRTPIAALRGNMEVALNRQCDTDELRHVLIECIDQFDRLSRIADDLLLLARADAGRDFLRRDRLSLADTVRDVVDLYGALVNERDIALTFNEQSAVEIDGDDTRIRQLLSNLLDNALCYTTAGGEISVELKAENGLAELTVRDTGRGIAAEHIPHVFERFYRADPARTRSSGGCGLGLAICQSIVEAHAGTIGISSQLDVGTQVTVRLPSL